MSFLIIKENWGLTPPTVLRAHALQEGPACPKSKHFQTSVSLLFYDKRHFGIGYLTQPESSTELSPTTHTHWIMF